MEHMTQTSTPTRDSRMGPVRRRRQAIFERDVAPDVHRLQHASTNAYLIEDGGAVTLVDSPFPRSRRHLGAALDEIGRSIADVRGLVLTHAHFGHLGLAAQLQESGVPLWLHEGDRPIAERPYSYRTESSRGWYPLHRASCRSCWRWPPWARCPCRACATPSAWRPARCSTCRGGPECSQRPGTPTGTSSCTWPTSMPSSAATPS